MQIVIDIDEGMYEKVIETNVVYVLEDVDCILIENAIANGTPLPKGHGRLIDADALNIRMEQRMDEIGDDESIWESSTVATALDMLAPTIIEADKVESEG